MCDQATSISAFNTNAAAGSASGYQPDTVHNHGYSLSKATGFSAPKQQAGFSAPQSGYSSQGSSYLGSGYGTATTYNPASVAGYGGSVGSYGGGSSLSSRLDTTSNEEFVVGTTLNMGSSSDNTYNTNNNNQYNQNQYNNNDHYNNLYNSHGRNTYSSSGGAGSSKLENQMLNSNKG